MGPTQDTREAGNRPGIILDTNLLAYYQLPSHVITEEHEEILSTLVSSIIDEHLNECGPLIVVDMLVDEIKNALRDKLIEKGVSRDAKIKSASRLIEDFREFLERLSQLGLVRYPEESGGLYRSAHWVYESIKKNCPDIIPKKRISSMKRDSMLVALAESYNAILVTRDIYLYKAITCLHARSHRRYYAILIYINKNIKYFIVDYCGVFEQHCILELIRDVVVNKGWYVEVNKNCR